MWCVVLYCAFLLIYFIPGVSADHLDLTMEVGDNKTKEVTSRDLTEVTKQQ